ncbi:MAG: hypothetical protein PHG82_02960 [Candidatus Gracilibacteria bacterium]|nr:hypothetical protein [Candidatus Gracilibacteria bacterium]
MNIKSIIGASLLTVNLLASEQVQDNVNSLNAKLLRSLSEEEVLGYQLYNVEGQINKDIKTSIVRVGKEIEYILPKGVRMHGDEQNLRVFYQVKF